MMNMRLGAVLPAILTIGLVGGRTAMAADQTILGSSFQAKSPSTPDKRKIGVKAKEKVSPNTIVGDPVANGGALTVRANGTSSTAQSFALPTGISPMTGKPFWSGDATKGFKYKDSKFENGAVKQVSIKKTGSGVFLIKAQLSGKLAPLNVVPPNTGTDACALLTLGGGDTYSIRFAFGDGLITNKGAAVYKHAKVLAEGTCVTTTTTTTTTTTSTTTTTTIPGCSPNCGIGLPCLTASNCSSGVCAGGFCRCPNQAYTFTVNSNGGGVFDSAEWPGGTAAQTAVTGCSVTINRPNDNVDLVCSLAAPFGINSFSGYSNCFGNGGEDGDGCQPVSCPPAGVGSCCNTRPSCSAALNGSAQAQYFVQCLQ
jgi:hypothetical protein